MGYKEMDHQWFENNYANRLFLKKEFEAFLIDPTLGRLVMFEQLLRGYCDETMRGFFHKMSKEELDRWAGKPKADD